MLTRLLSLLVLGIASVPALAELIPTSTVHEMCADAKAIVVGEQIGASQIRVEEWLLAPTEAKWKKDVLEVVTLSNHSRTISRLAGPKRSLKTRRFVCFLTRKGVAWYPMQVVGTGSSGLVWIEDNQCFRYRQEMSPGPLRLLPDEKLKNEKDLRAEIEKGMHDRRAWKRLEQIIHPEEKAIVLASYLLARTSPEGARDTYRRRVRRVLPQLGEDAVAELGHLLRTARPEDDLNQTVLVLYDLGRHARPLVPLLAPILEEPKKAHPVRVLEALGRIGDTRVAQDVIPFLKHEELPVKAEAAKALAAFRYQDAADAIAGAIPGKAKEGEAYFIYAMLQSLHELDPAQASQLTRRYLDQPAMTHVRNLLDPFLKK